MRAPRPVRASWPLRALQTIALTLGIVLVLPFAVYQLATYGRIREWK